MNVNLEKGGGKGEQYKVATQSRISILKQLKDFIKQNPLYAKYL